MHWIDSFMAIFGYKRVKPSRKSVPKSHFHNCAEQAVVKREPSDIRTTWKHAGAMNAHILSSDFDIAVKWNSKQRTKVIGDLLDDVLSGRVTAEQAAVFSSKLPALNQYNKRQLNIRIKGKRMILESCRRKMGMTVGQFVSFAIHRHIAKNSFKGVGQ